MSHRQRLDLATSRGWWVVDCAGGTRFLLDLDQGAVLREPAGGRRLPWDGVFVRGAYLVDEASGLPVISVGAQARWQIGDRLFVFTGKVTRIAAYRASTCSAPGVVRAPVRAVLV
ncbi:hypothetical protein GALL_284990 [mine drainage metagenome]|uniref:Uncharacterized protein n=1 Tax=mine drainage metagenome TaxID=410659 RepID=A0A1J5RBW7_9ZZZZ